MPNQDTIDELKIEIVSQKNEIARLRSDLEHLNDMCKSVADDTTEHINYIYKYLKTLDDRGARDLKIHVQDFKLLVEYLVVLQDSVSPLEDELFPGVSKARQQLTAIQENIKVTSHEKDD
jgi:uncharacterized coiled-coil protein SlyX